MRERGTQSRRNAEFGPDTEPVRPVRRPPTSGGSGSSGGFWPALAIVAIIIATAGWTTVAVMALNGGGSRAAAVASEDDTLPTDDPSDIGETDPPVEVSHDAPDLEAFLPTTVGVTTFMKQSQTGDTALQEDSDWNTSLETFLTSKGKTPADLAIAQAYDVADPDNGPSVGVYRVKGVSAADIQTAIIAAFKIESPDVVISTITIAGRSVTKGAFGDGYFDSYWYQRDDLLFDIETTDPSFVGSALQSLPTGAGGASPSPAASASGSTKPSTKPSAQPAGSAAPSASPS